MVKKFKNPTVDSEPVADTRKISLCAYLQQSASDVLIAQAFMPETTALAFWQHLFQPSRHDEHLYFCHKQQGLRWPYADRLIYLAREFSRLEPRSQVFIMKAAEKAIWWRGDNIQQFRHIVQAQLSYQRLDAEQRLLYRKQLMQTAKQLLAK